MNILPKLLYVMQTVPIHLPQSIFASYRKACSDFLWGKNHPRLSFERLTQPKLKGGIGLPDIAKYHIACQLSQIVDWNVHSHTKAWTKIENEFSSIPIRLLPWINSSYTPQVCKRHPLIGITLQTFQKACRKQHISSTQGPLTPIRNNPDFPAGLSDTFLADFWPHVNVRAEHFFSRHTFVSCSDLPTQKSGKPFPQWMYFQIRHFLNHAHKRSDFSRSLTPFEILCTKTEPQRRDLSNLFPPIL